MDSLLLRDCDEASCLAESCWAGPPAGEYYVVVDGQEARAGPFDLEVICFDPAQFNRWYACEGPEDPEVNPLTTR